MSLLLNPHTVRLMRYSCCSCLCLLLVLAVSPKLWAQPTLLLKNEKGYLSIQPEHIKLLEDKHNALTFNEVLVGQKMFYTPGKLNFGFSSTTYWVKLRLRRPSQGSDRIVGQSSQWFLLVDYAPLDSIKVYYQDYDKKWRSYSVGDMVPINKRSVFFKSAVIPLHLIDEGAHNFYLKVRTKGSVQLPISIQSASYFQRYSLTVELLYGGFYGGLFLIMLYNFFLWVAIRERSYLIYCFYITSFILAQLSLQGHGFLYLWGAYPRVANLMLPISMTIASGFGITFAMYFLSTHKQMPRWHIFLLGIALFCFSFGLLSPLLNYNLTILVATSSVMVMSVLMIITGVLSWIWGNRSAKLFVLGWSAAMLGILLLAFKLSGYLYWAWLDYAPQGGTLLQVLLLSLALADKINIYRQEKEKAQQEALIVARENERIILEQNQTLETRVRERTEEIMVQNEELQQQREEILAQRNFIEAKNAELEKAYENLKYNKDQIEQSQVAVQQANEQLQENNQVLELQKAALEQANDKLKEYSQELQLVQKDLEAKHQELVLHDKKLQSSIEAALTIQQAVLPYEEKLKKLLGEYFVIYQPKDIVSGDFYWLNAVDEEVILVVADCTGHGVSGAFMTLIGHTLLDRIVRFGRATNPAEILSRLHRDVQVVLKQRHTQNNSGMDAAICNISPTQFDTHTQLVFAGAKHSLYYVEPNDPTTLKELKGTRKGIGGMQNEERAFENSVLILERGTMVYLLTDGLQDQNNQQRQKFGKRRLQEELLAIHHLPIDTQKLYLNQLIQEHMGQTEQRDDMLVLGFRL
ncbi:7TM diverse intracellular signaling domain-containing protein [Eisenibacter elegans]|uniref:7TM diverse intracellular signaling domain-containing protein n=1 Tax=Eisenibacter elegans TaxID=997 RepID=UPI0012B56DF8|nr:7TM diverse intracellular signaling domain-containing protein [Eisenibacter elegans]